MPTTSNFGWTTPADTDLVKNGALAIRTLGNGIDTSLLDLKGGTTGQILSKASNTDLDYTWINNDQGDITEVQAGTGISVASGSGPIPVVTNTVATAFDAKGDLIGGTGADTFSRLAVGTNGQVLTADSTTATGLKWATAAASSGPAFQAFRTTSDQTVTQNAWTKIAFNAEDYDTDSCFDSTTNYRFTPNKAGYYLLTAAIFTSANSAASVDLSFYKNGATNNTCGFRGAASSVNFVALGTNLMYFNGSTDYCELYIYMAGASPKVWTRANSECTYFSGVWIRS